MNYSARVRVGTPQSPVSSHHLPSHLTEKERMLSGLPYNAYDSELEEGRARSQRLCIEYNNYNKSSKAPINKGEIVSKRRAILGEWLHPDCKGKANIEVKPPFRTDYGSNIKVRVSLNPWGLEGSNSKVSSLEVLMAF
jgi:hypothetical protein